MKLDPNSREELPAVLRVALQWQQIYPEWEWPACTTKARALLAAYNEGQPDEPSAKMPTALDGRGWYVKDLEDTLATIAKAVGLAGEPDADALIAKVKELAKPMPTREEMVERWGKWKLIHGAKSIFDPNNSRALIDYLHDGEAK